MDYLDLNIDKLLSSIEPQLQLPAAKKEQILSNLLLEAAQAKKQNSTRTFYLWLKLTAAAILVFGLVIAGLYLLKPESPSVKPQQIAHQPAPGKQSADELKTVEQLFAAKNAAGLVAVLEKGKPQTQIAAADYLAQIGDVSAIAPLQKLSQKWDPAKGKNPFASAIEKIQARQKPKLADVNIIKEPNSAIAGQTPKSDCVLCGHITDAKTGKPVTDATITLFGSPDKAETDSNGFYCFDKIKQPGNHKIAIDSNEYFGIIDQQSMLPVQLSSDSKIIKDFILDKACIIEILVVDEANKPVEGAELSITSLAGRYGGNLKDQRTPRRTDKDGICLLGGLQPSKAGYSIIAAHGIDVQFISKNGIKINTKKWDYAPANLIVILKDTEFTESAKIVLQKGINVKGQALYQDGAPASDLMIYAYPRWWSVNTSPESHSIEPDGSFTLRNIIPGTYKIEARIPKARGTHSLRQITAMLPDDEPLKLTMAQKSPWSLASISGRLVFTGGKIPDDIYFEAINRFNFGFPDFAVPSPDACELNFIIDRIEPGEYKLTFSSSQIEQKVIENVVAPTENLVVELTPAKTANLSGIVLNPQNNQPVCLFKARFKKREGGSFYISQSDLWSDFNDANGRFNLVTEGLGIYKVQIAAEGFAWTWSQDINTCQNTPSVIKLSPGGAVTGKVVNEESKPLNGAKIIPLSKAGSISGYSREEFISEDGAVETVNGIFDLKRLAPGSETLKVVHPDYVSTIVRDINVTENLTTGDIVIVLHKGSSVQGFVYDNRGLPQANVTLNFQNSPGSGISLQQMQEQLASAITDANGFYHVDGLPEQLCFAKRLNEWDCQGVICRSFVPAQGKVTRLYFGGKPLITGRIIIDGTPLAGHKIIVSEIGSVHSSLFKCSVITGPDGSFSFSGVPKGKWAIFYENPENRRIDFTKIATFDCAGMDLNLGVIPQDTTTVRVSLEFEPNSPKWDILYADFREDNKPWSQMSVKFFRPFDANEPCILKNILSGKYILTLTRQDYIRFDEQIVIDKNCGDITIKLPQCTSGIFGHINRKPDNSSIYSEDKKIIAAIGPDDNGNYKLENLPAGKYHFGINSRTNSESLIDFELTRGEQKEINIDILDIPSPHPGILTAVALDENGIPLNFADVRLETGDSVIDPSSNSGNSIYFSAEPGAYTLRASYPGYKDFTKPVTVKPFYLQNERDLEPMLFWLEKAAAQ